MRHDAGNYSRIASPNQANTLDCEHNHMRVDSAFVCREFRYFRPETTSLLSIGSRDGKLRSAESKVGVKDVGYVKISRVYQLQGVSIVEATRPRLQKVSRLRLQNVTYLWGGWHHDHLYTSHRSDMPISTFLGASLQS